MAREIASEDRDHETMQQRRSGARRERILHDRAGSACRRSVSVSGLKTRSVDCLALAVRIEGVGGDPARHHHHRHAGPGMGRAAGEIEAAHLPAAVAGLEGAHELAVARQPVDRAVEHLVAVVDVLRREMALDDDALLDVAHAGRALELVEDRLPIGREHLRPVVMRAKIRRVDENVERLAALRRDARIGRGRRREIAGRIRRRLAPAIDVVELLLRIAREHEIVVEEVIVALA